MGITVSPADADGEFRRAVTVFRNFIEEGGQFPPEKGRYHLYVSLACPWGINPPTFVTTTDKSSSHVDCA